jgi:hypothetical protein
MCHQKENMLLPPIQGQPKGHIGKEAMMIVKIDIHGIRAYHRTNVAYTTYPVTRTRKNTGLHVREGVEK